MGWKKKGGLGCCVCCQESNIYDVLSVRRILEANPLLVMVTINPNRYTDAIACHSTASINAESCLGGIRESCTIIKGTDSEHDFLAHLRYLLVRATYTCPDLIGVTNTVFLRISHSSKFYQKLMLVTSSLHINSSQN